MKEEPYLSIVATSRNDHHGGDVLKRMRLFVAGLIAQTSRHRLPAELVLVEWNPPEDQPLLQHILPKPEHGDFLSIRYLIVPKEIHQRYKRSKELTLFQMIAKNVGIRRAKGEFVLCTNIDILFSDKLFKALAARKLRSDTFYRANRCDVPDLIDPAWDISKQLAWCDKNIIRRLGMNTRFKNMNPEMAGFRNETYWKQWMFNKAAWMLNLFLPEERRKYYQADCVASGDFTLMAKTAWLDIQGYLELDLHAVHVDKLAILAALAIGYHQHVFPSKACTYHIEHTEGRESMTPLEKVRFQEEKPGIDYGLVYDLGQHVLKNKGTYDVNPDNWGYSNLVFAEHNFP
jgi:hypothetical protein